MTQDEDPDRTEPVAPQFDNGDAARHVARLTGMSAEAAAAFADYHSGRFSRGSAFRDAA